MLYSLWLIPDLLKYDHVVHAYGFGVTTLACWEGLCAILTAQRNQVESSVPVPTLGMLTLCGAASLGFGALNEVVEFFLTHRCHILEASGESYRLRDAKRRKQPVRSSTSDTKPK